LPFSLFDCVNSGIAYCVCGVSFFSGKIQDGEILLEVNDQSVVGLTLYDLNNLIKQAKDPVTFKTVKEGYILMLYVAIQCHISYMKKHHANTH